MKRPSAAVVLLLILAQIALPAPSRACSIAMSIWYSIEGAEAILLVRIESLETHVIQPPARESVLGGPRKRTAAVLRVLEEWKGDVPVTIDADLGEEYSRPRWKQGEVFVAFLESGHVSAAQGRESRSSTYETLASMIADRPHEIPEDPAFPRTRAELDRMRRDAEVADDAFEAWMADRWSLNRVLTLDGYSEDSDFAALGDVVRLAVKLHAAGSDDAARLDWHITAAAHRATRREGLFELYSFIRFPLPPMEFHVFETEDSDEGQELAPDTEQYPADDAEPPPSLNREQLRRLAEGFAKEPAVNETSVTMLQLLSSYPDLEVDRAAASVVEAGLLLRPIPGWVLEMVDEALERYGDNFIGRDDRDPRGRPIYTGQGENTLPTIWEVARRELGIPQVLPAVPPGGDD
jgi:hypothetical protein